MTPEVNGIPLSMELDTGASVSLISTNVWQSKLKRMPLESTSIVLKTYTGEKLELEGQAMVQVKYHDQEAKLPLLVIKGTGPSLLGRNWLQAIRLNWGEIKHVSSELDQLIAKFPEVFKEGLGTVKGCQVKLSVKEGAKPKFFKPRSVPFALKEAIEKDLDRLEQLGVVTKVNYSEWAAPIVVVPKPDGSVRICGDYKVTINPVLEVDHYPLPTPEDLFATVAGAKCFSKLDLSQAYQQVELKEESRKFVTVSTHRGLYQYNRLPFGVASAPAVFQKLMEQTLQGKTPADHWCKVEEVLERLNEWGFRLKRSKCSFLQSAVEYLGYRIDSEGLHTTTAKIEAILEAPKPSDLRQLRSFLGLVNYYGRFVPNLATVAHPLNNLLKQNAKWKWTSDCEKAFKLLKGELASASVLVHYDINLPIRLACDASAYGVGAVISHVLPDSSERPIAYASRSLSSAERNYSQMEREALGIIFGVKKFHKFLYGRSFTLVTDHKPLVTILSPTSPIPTLAAARLQRWALLLSAYQYTVQFRPTAKHGNADALSRLPLWTKHPEVFDPVPSAVNVLQISTLPLKAVQLKTATDEDRVLGKVRQYIVGGWPGKIDSELKVYFNRQE